jgi:diaminopimelate epimerase
LIDFFKHIFHRLTLFLIYANISKDFSLYQKNVNIFQKDRGEKMLKFTKMEGLGNDYIYVDGIHQKVDMTPELITRISDRHFGIGSDGMIVILPSQKYDFFMRMFNRDGSEGKMCGNGIRCFAKFVYDHHLTDQTYLEIETLAGVKRVWLHVENGTVQSVKVDMGQPSLNTQDIPCLFNKEQMVDEPLNINHHIYRCTAVSMGNPHVVTYVDQLDFEIEKIGPYFEKNEMFPESVNTEFVQVIDRQHLKMRVWERGSGETMACGTGACAVMYASYVNGLCDSQVDVELLGGILNIQYQDGHIFMEGPARTVFEGIMNEEDFKNV